MILAEKNCGYRKVRFGIDPSRARAKVTQKVTNFDQISTLSSEKAKFTKDHNRS